MRCTRFPHEPAPRAVAAASSLLLLLLAGPWACKSGKPGSTAAPDRASSPDVVAVRADVQAPEPALDAAASTDEPSGGDVEDDADAGEVGASEAQLRALLGGHCPPPSDSTLQPDPDSGLTCSGPPLDNEDEYAACEQESARLRAAFRLMRQDLAKLMGEHKPVEARRQLRWWLGRHPCSTSCEVPREMNELALTLEVAIGLEEALEQRGAVVLERPARVFVREYALLRTRADGLAPRALLQSAPSTNRLFDVWAFVPDGWVLVADPFVAPAFAVLEPPTAMLGWVRACELSDRPQGPLVVDVAHPLDIVRPSDAIVEGEDGGSCSVGGKPGRSYVLWPDGRGDCVLYSEMCGGPGLTPPSWDLQGPDESGCGDCCTLGRSMVEVGDFCRAAEPGWTWQCSADNEKLECRTPPPRAETRATRRACVRADGAGCPWP